MSPAVRSEVELAAPPERVWEVVMDPHRLELWVTAHAGLGGDAPQALGAESTFEQELTVGGLSFAVTWKVTACEHPRAVTWEGSGPAGASARVRYTLAPAGEGGTRFGYENEFELPGGTLGRLAGRAVGRRRAQREAERSLENLKRLLEG